MPFVTGYVIGLSQVEELGFTQQDRDVLNQLAAGNLGTGPRVVTFTVTDGTTPIQGAAVALRKSGSYNNGVTDVNGQIIFAVVDSPGYQYAIVAQGFVSSAGTLDVNGNQARTVVMTQQVIPSPSQPNEVVVYVGTNPPTEGVEITLSYETQSITTSGLIPLENSQTSATNDQGIAAFSTSPSVDIRPAKVSEDTHSVVAKVGDRELSYRTRVPPEGGNLGPVMLGAN